jgi:hypothetical protein
MALAGCSSTASAEGYDLIEFAIEGASELPADVTSVAVTNSGEFPHTLVVTDVGGEVIAATDVLQPGQGAELALDLEPGRYSFTCRIVAQTPEGEIVDHFEQGMSKTVSVSG